MRISDWSSDVCSSDLNIGAVIRHTEDGFDLLDCDNCIVAPACGLTGILRQALGAFLCVLDAYTLADLLTKRSDLARLFASDKEAASSLEERDRKSTRLNSSH